MAYLTQARVNSRIIKRATGNTSQLSCRIVSPVARRVAPCLTKAMKPHTIWQRP
ncbi:MAG: hypothetical protein IJR26_04310 [Bacteroidales bacterium]|nr:hypothetical protein [Bacteroidales bacterium]